MLEDKKAIEEADILICDYYLPGLNGMEVISKVRELRPTLPVILLSGAREPVVVESLRTMPKARFLSKPIDLDDLKRGINDLVDEMQAA